MVRSCFNLFCKNNEVSSIPDNVLKAINHLREVKISPNLLFFGLRLLLRGSQPRTSCIREIFWRRDLNCVFCNLEEEIIPHLFEHYLYSDRIWRKLYVWIGNSLELTLEEFVVFFDNCVRR